MYRSTHNFGKKRSFTLVEVMVATFISLYTLLAVTGAYVMFWTWWHETLPEIEAQKTARITLSEIIYGKSDSTAGTYTIGTSNFTRRNGIAGAVRAPTTPTYQQINFGLGSDVANSRSYYLGLDPATNLNAVYYKNSDGTISMIPSTLGIYDLKFEFRTYIDADGIEQTDTSMVIVTATVEKEIVGGATPHRVHVVYSQLVSLRNVT